MPKKNWEIFNDKFGTAGKLIELRSPGRVNLIGEHTDYNNGLVFPAAINLEINGAAVKRNDSLVRVYSEDFHQMQEFDLNKITKTENSWINYIKGVALELQKKGELTYGVNAAYKSAIPVGSGLSSSAAFELINAVLLAEVNHIKISKKELALLCQSAENNFVGVNCGIMDQFAIALGKKDSALFLDTRTLEYETVDLNLSGYKIVIGNTNKPRALSCSAYNTRRRECETAVNILKQKDENIKSLRDVSPVLLENHKKLLPENIYKRAKHIVQEIRRVEKAVEFLKKKDLTNFGRLMIDSHYTLKNLYEVSCFELDTLVEEALKIKGVLGSRMTGAGFGGCTVSLVDEKNTDDFIARVGKNYKKKTNLTPDFYITEAVNGAEII